MMNDPYGFALKVLLGSFLGFLTAMIIVGVINFISNDGKSYETRIEEKYNIEVTEINNMKYGGGTVIYRNSEGLLCSADMAENDVLVGENCEQP